MLPAQHIGTEDKRAAAEDTLRRLLRARLCPQCLAGRGLGSAVRGAAEIVACEARCPIFRLLPTLTKYVENPDALAGSYDGVVHAVAAFCPTCGSDAAWRSQHHSGCRHDCPLHRHQHEIAALLQEAAECLHGQPAGRR